MNLHELSGDIKTKASSIGWKKIVVTIIVGISSVIWIRSEYFEIMRGRSGEEGALYACTAATSATVAAGPKAARNKGLY